MRDQRQQRERRQTVDDGRFLVEGQSALAEYLRFRPDSIRELVFKPGQEKTLADIVRQFPAAAKIPRMAMANGLTTPVGGRVELSLRSWEGFFTEIQTGNRPPLVLALDHVQDPRNLGAIVRSAAFFGITHVIVPNRRQVLLSQAAVSTAQGGFALVDLVECVNLVRALELLKEAEFWILGADMGGEPVASLRGFYDHAVLVMGAEDKGLGALVQKNCDRIVSIPGAASGLESLNVSVAAGILLSHLVVH